MDPHVAEYDRALRWYGYKAVPMSQVDYVLFAIENGYHTMGQLLRVSGFTSDQISSCAAALIKRGDIRRAGVGTWKAVDNAR